MLSGAGKIEYTEVADVLLERGKISARQADLARRRAGRQGLPLHRALVDLNAASELDIYSALAEVLGLRFATEEVLRGGAKLSTKVPVKVALEYGVLPIAADEAVLWLASAEPLGTNELSRLRLILGQRIRYQLGSPALIHAGVERLYGLGADTVQQLREDRGLGEGESTIRFDMPLGAGVESADEDLTAEEASISKLVAQILDEAIRLDATDVHFEPYPSGVKLRYRIDGLLRDIPVPGGMQSLFNSVVSRLKVMAALNIAERRLPHDGRISMRRAGYQYDLRVSILPTRLGESVCLRVLSRSDLQLDFTRLGMTEPQQTLVRGMMGLNQGLILLTGPTGSGKTTTLYTALEQTRDSGRKVITVEDPVEYQMEGISQIQIRPEIGLTFSSGLRSILRHDPDVVLVGEIRDAETAGIAMRAAQTGHLVLSTLHTNDSPGAVLRLMEMGVEPFLIASSLICSIAQRLVRRNCLSCRREEVLEDKRWIEEMETVFGSDQFARTTWRGDGCVECGGTGYRGREALYEMLAFGDAVSAAICPGLSLDHLRLIARENGWRPLRENGWIKVRDGILSIDELNRVTRRAEDVIHTIRDWA